MRMNLILFPPPPPPLNKNPNPERESLRTGYHVQRGSNSAVSDINFYNGFNRGKLESLFFSVRGGK